MKKYILPFISIAMLLAMVSCSSSDDAVAEKNVESKLVPMTFTATQENNVGTRSELNSSNKVIWQTYDKISVFDGFSTGNNREFKLTSDVETGTFSGTASSDASAYTAVYPYTEGATLNSDGSVSGMTLPASQTAIENSFDPKAAIMMAVSTIANKYKLDFKNAVSLVKVTPHFDCSKIELTAADGSSDVLAGKGTLNWNGGEPTINITEGASNKITLNGPIAKDNNYYIVVPAGDLKRMWKITFTANDVSNTVYTRYCSNSLNIARNKIIKLGDFATDSPFWADSHRGNKVTYEQEVDLGLTITKADGNYKVIFAKSNLTATGLAEKETDFGDYFAWGATEPWLTSYTRSGSGNSLTMNDEAWNNSLNNTSYNWSTVPYKDITEDKCTKYLSSIETLASVDDAAHNILEGDWQLPTKEIWANLYENGTKSHFEWEWTIEDGYNGYRVKSKIDGTKSIFLPAAGIVGETTFYDYGTYGNYWSGTAYSNTYSYFLDFNCSSVNPENEHKFRFLGLTVRPVRLVAE